MVLFRSTDEDDSFWRASNNSLERFDSSSSSHLVCPSCSSFSFVSLSTVSNNGVRSARAAATSLDKLASR